MILSLFITTTLIISFSMVLSLSEASIVGFSRYKAANLIKQELYGAKLLLSLDEKRTQVLSTIIMLNTAVNIGGSMLVGVLASGVFEGRSYGVFVGVLTFFMLLFSEVKPKIFASRYPEKVARYLAAPLLVINGLMRPLTWVSEILIGGKAEVQQLTEYEVKAVIAEANDKGVLGDSKGKLMSNILLLGGVTAKDVLVTDGCISTIEISHSVACTLNQCVDTQYKRLIAVNRLGDAVGVINVSDVLSASAKGLDENCIADFVYPLPQVGRNVILSEVLVRLFRSQNHIIGVTDNDGSLLGVITLSNVIEHLLD
ncbi:conserved membrane hypothetical protein [Vibrio chagasii]|nr:conserved membrane hypothetical protein [Vibrio chagasii]